MPFYPWFHCRLSISLCPAMALWVVLPWKNTQTVYCACFRKDEPITHTDATTPHKDKRGSPQEHLQCMHTEHCAAVLLNFLRSPSAPAQILPKPPYSRSLIRVERFPPDLFWHDVVFHPFSLFLINHLFFLSVSLWHFLWSYLSLSAFFFSLWFTENSHLQPWGAFDGIRGLKCQGQKDAEW